MQERERENRERLSRVGTFVATFVGKGRKAGRSRLDEPGIQSPKGALTGFNRLARCSMIVAPGDRTPDAREEAMQ